MKRRTIVMGLITAVPAAAAFAISRTPGERPANGPVAVRVAPAETAEASSATPSAPPPPTTPTPVSPEEQARLGEAVSAAVHAIVPKTRIGLAVYDRRRDSMLAGVNADERFYTASVVKLLIATEVLRQSDWHVPTGSQRDRLVSMLARSADWAAATLWSVYGGTTIARRAAELMRLTDTLPPATPSRWELTRMSPRDIVTIYRYLDAEMPDAAGEFALGTLAGATHIAADGFDQYFGIPGALASTEWAIKQGWMEINSGIVLNTTGIVGPDRRYVVALLTHQPRATTFARGRKAVTAGIAALAPALVSGAA